MNEHVAPVEHGAEHHVLVQAPVAPVDVDGVRAVQVGTVVFAVLSLVALLNRAALEAAGRGWWLWVCVVGLCMGPPVLLFLRRRRSRRSPE